jgi:RND family efflux transporter MFP subunit
VTTEKPTRRTVRRNIDQPGQIEAFQNTPVYAKTAGYVRKVHKDIGDAVRAGDLLAEVWVPELEEEYQEKKALAEQARAEVELAQKAHEAARAGYDTALAQVEVEQAGRARADALVKRWQSEYDRLKPATRSGTLDRQTLDETEYQLEAAQAARKEVDARVKAAEAGQKEAGAKRDKALAEVAAAAARQRVAEAAQRRMGALVDYTRVRAPFQGVVSQRKVDEGHLLEMGAGSKGEALFVVVQTDPVRIFVDVPEADAAWVKDGATANIRIQALGGASIPGMVTRNAWALDYSPAKAARTLRTEIDLPNADGRLRPGMYARAVITLEHANVWTVPAAAVVTDGDQTICWRVENGKALRTPVQVGLRGGSLVEVVKKQTKPVRPGEAVAWEEITGNEEIITGNVAGLKDGDRVAVGP